MKRAAIILLLLFFSATHALAVSCHCFNNREYDAADPSSADTYILATGASSLLVGAAQSEKSVIVRLRMGGASEADVWLGLMGAYATGKSTGDFFSAHDKLGSWAKAYTDLGLDPLKFGKAFAEAIPRDEEVATRLVSDMTLVAAFPAEKEVIAKLRAEKATTQEIAVSLFLKAAAAKEPLETLKSVKSGGVTWGALLNRAGYTPKEFSKKMTALARPLF